ncbi:MAG: TonB-dependent receptor [Bryobacterales bacterium]|nr:TonB-dependent receptor [Bryobacterales bacterium]
MSRIPWPAYLVFIAQTGWGQTGTGHISGRVVSDTREPIHLASVRLVSGQTARAAETATSDQGDFAFAAVAPGVYQLHVSARGLTTLETPVTVLAGARVRADFVLSANGDGRVVIDDLMPGRLVSEAEIGSLPNLTRDVFRFTGLTGNASEAGLGTRGTGFAFNGQREASTAILVDGAEAKDEFFGTAGRPIPVDAVAAVSVLNAGFTAEFGRAGGAVVNVTGRQGDRTFHGSGYVFSRLPALSANSFDANSRGLRRPGFDRNQFGLAAGGPIVSGKLFFFANAEGTLIRSRATQAAWVVTPQLLAETAANTRSYFQQLGQLRPGSQITRTASLADLTAIIGRNPCLGLLCARLPATFPLFSRVTWDGPGDDSGGIPGDGWNLYNRVDYNVSQRTTFYGRYQHFQQRDQEGTLAQSPYADYDLRQQQTAKSVLLIGSHSWSPRWTSNLTAAFDRLTIEQQGLTSRGVVPGMYANPFGPVTIGLEPVAFPGYSPYTPGSAGRFGGPQSTVQVKGDTGWTRGRHDLRFGGSYWYLRDNRTDATYENAVASLSNVPGLGGPLAGLLFGTFAQMQVAVDPQGQLPCGTVPTCSLRLPLRSPSFSRSNRFHDGALYIQDFWRPARRLSVTAGLRWEYFGVQHNGDPTLESNWYAPRVASPDTELARYLLEGGLQRSTDSTAGGLYRPDFNNFAPRVGMSWDVSGDGKTIVRGGYGIGFERNFGNVDFNVMQNLPNHAVLSVPGPITTDNFGPLSNTSGQISLPPAGARIINPSLKTAHAHLWNASVQRQVWRAVTYTFQYSGSKGADLYSISYPNQKGFRNFVMGEVCTGRGDCRTSPNPYYSQEVGYRGNQGYSRYYGIDNRLSVNNLLASGVVLTASYTWARAVDNLSSTFFEAGGRGVTNRFGDRNITVNNGNFVRGLLDPFRPGLDEGSADFDVRHRVVVSGNWSVQVWKRWRRSGMLLSGWNVAPIWTARSGQPFSVFDSIAQTLDLNTPRATFTKAVSTKPNTFVAAPGANTFQIYTFFPAEISHEPNLLTPTSNWLPNMSKRNSFRAPGFHNLDVAIYKDTRLNEKLTLQLRGEFFNLLNHANLYLIGTTANTGAGNTIDGCFGCTGSSYDRRQIQVAARIRF